MNTDKTMEESLDSYIKDLRKNQSDIEQIQADMVLVNFFIGPKCRSELDRRRTALHDERSKILKLIWELENQ